MAIYYTLNKAKLYIGTTKVKNAYLGATKIYSSGEIVTYIVDGSVWHKQEYEEGQSVLSPSKSPSKSGYTFAGWSKTASGDVVKTLVMADKPITLYAVFVQASAWNFAYSGTVVSWTVPVTGLYLIDLRGGGGGGGSRDRGNFKAWGGGTGGKTTYYASLKKNETIYIAVGGGGKGLINHGGGTVTGGYNGGADGYRGGLQGGGGGGATHVAKAAGVLKEVSKSNLLAVAGGGGGGGQSDECVTTGGKGGGTTGGVCVENTLATQVAATQTSPGTNTGVYGGQTGAYGQGGSPSYYGGGGGGGLYGGAGGQQDGGGGGGSGYVDRTTTVFNGRSYVNYTEQGNGGSGGSGGGNAPAGTDRSGGNGSLTIKFVTA